jgi:nucleotide-binding universal stress UspA family protein
MEFRRIVVSTDFTENSLPALEAAFGLASEMTVKLYIVHVVEIPAVAAPPMASVVPPVDQLYKAAKERLDGLVPENFKYDMAIETVVLTGTPAAAISEFAKDKDVDIIVVGTHGRKGLARVLMGSTAEALLREAPCQVLVVKPKAPSSDVHPHEAGEPAR